MPPEAFCRRRSPGRKEGLADHELAPVQLNIGRLVVVHTSVRLPVAILGDKIVQKCLVWVLEQIYEEDFLGFSCGFRPR